MKPILLAVLILALWVGLTTAAIAVTPERNDDELPDLSVDPHWLLRTPPNPVPYDRMPVGTRATTTTTRFTTPGPIKRAAAPRPPPPTSGGVEQWRSLVASQGGWDTNLMLRIMGCESGGNASAKNRSSSATGLFQILGGPYDPVANVELAHSMWSTRGTQPWNSSAGCWRG